jgi:hypothetical protein
VLKPQIKKKRVFTISRPLRLEKTVWTPGLVHVRVQDADGKDTNTQSHRYGFMVMYFLT